MAFAPDDYRQRHPIVVQEQDRSIEVFVGTSRGGLTARAAHRRHGLAQTWLHEGTGPISIDLPVATPNARAATQSLHDIQAIFVVRRRAARAASPFAGTRRRIRASSRRSG